MALPLRSVLTLVHLCLFLFLCPRAPFLNGIPPNQAVEAGPAPPPQEVVAPPEDAPTTAELEILYEAVSANSAADKSAQKHADSLLTLDTPSDEDCSQAQDAVMSLKKSLDASIETRGGLVNALRTLLSHQRAAAQKLADSIKVSEAKVEVAKGITKQLREDDGDDGAGPPAKKAKVNDGDGEYVPMEDEYEP